MGHQSKLNFLNLENRLVEMIDIDKDRTDIKESIIACNQIMMYTKLIKIKMENNESGSWPNV